MHINKYKIYAAVLRVKVASIVMLSDVVRLQRKQAVANFDL